MKNFEWIGPKAHTVLPDGMFCHGFFATNIQTLHSKAMNRKKISVVSHEFCRF